jgi:hypothetical protein
MAHSLCLCKISTCEKKHFIHEWVETSILQVTRSLQEHGKTLVVLDKTKKKLIQENGPDYFD